MFLRFCSMNNERHNSFPYVCSQASEELLWELFVQAGPVGKLPTLSISQHAVTFPTCAPYFTKYRVKLSCLVYELCFVPSFLYSLGVKCLVLFQSMCMFQRIELQMLIKAMDLLSSEVKKMLTM